MHDVHKLCCVPPTARLLCVLLLFTTAFATEDTCSAGSTDGLCSRDKRVPKKKAVSTTGLRFGVGDHVLVQMGRREWKVGQVSAVNHREPNWPVDQVAPYLVELAQGGVVYAPVDDPRLIRQASEDDMARMRKADKVTKALARDAEAFKTAQLRAAEDLQVRPDLVAVLRYHAESCHVRPGLYANGGSMDWENQPDKFRRVLGSRSLDLPRSGATVSVPSGVPLQNLDALGVLLHDAGGITAWKSQGPRVKYSLRANPSSGALQPLEIYVFGAVGDEQAAHWHYNAYWHSLEHVAMLPPERWALILEQLPKGTILVGLTSIVWRNAWKYGDPGFRYTHHDVGHQISSFAFAAAAQQATVVLLDSLTDDEISGFMRADEPEDPVCLLAVFPNAAMAPSGEWWREFRMGKNFWKGMSKPTHSGAPVDIYYGKSEAAARPIIASVRAASTRHEPPSKAFWSAGAPPRDLPSAWAAAGPLRPLIHTRRSAQNYNPDAAPRGGLPGHLFYDMLRRVLNQPAWFPWKAAVQPFLFVHRVAGLKRGIYLMCRGRDCDELRPDLDPTHQFLWQKVPGAPPDVPLVLLRRGDVREEARLGSCVQDIASDSAFAVAFLAEHLPALKTHGAWWYRRVHWEACALGGALYLAAGAAGTSAGRLQSTGIGCFFAPWVQALLKVDAPNWADVYHFTLGWPDEDRRVDVKKPPYHHADAMRGRNRDTVSSRGE